jgi:glucosamine-6-phosphate deaminase
VPNPPNEAAGSVHAEQGTTGMRVIVCRDPDESADLVTGEILAALTRKPDLVLGLATGSTPIGVYQRLVRAHQEDGVDFSNVRTFNLDEYLELPADHPQSYRYFMDQHLFNAIGIPEENIHFPPTRGPNLRKACRRHEEEIRECGGIDIQLLGIGSNGHIGFNEPTSSLASRTRVKTLTEKTLRDNSRFYADDEEQPTVAATLGIGTILDTKSILLQAFGSKKAEAVKACVEGPISSFWPGSTLQNHPDVTFFLDGESAAQLGMLDYYREVRASEVRLRDRDIL